jgi:CheY-like chemotaxis protein
MSDPTAARLLVVEDDPVFARMLVRRLESQGHVVELAHDGREGMKAIVASEPHLVLSDWMMPHVDGLELCRAVKTGLGDASPYFVLITAHDDISARILALETGADDYLIKPCHEGELAARVRSGLRQVALRQRIRAMAAELERLRAGTPSGADAGGVPGSIPICRHCGRVASDGTWQSLVEFLERNRLARFERESCPDCAARIGHEDADIRARAA